MIVRRTVSNFLSLITLTIASLLGTVCLGKQGTGLITERSDSNSTSSRFEPWGYKGSILLIGSGEPKLEGQVIDEFKKRMPKSQPTVLVLHSSATDPKSIEPFSAQMSGDFAATCLVCPLSNNPQQGIADGLNRACMEAIRNADGVWLMQASRDELLALSKNETLRNELHELLKRGGVVAASGESCGLLGQVAELSVSDSKDGLSSELNGYGFVPQARLWGSSEQGSGDEPSSLTQRAGRPRTGEKQAERSGSGAERPSTIGLGIDSNSAILLSSRSFRVIRGSVRVSLGAADYRPAETFQLSTNEVADWTQLCRAARDRMKNVDPGKTNEVASLQSGSLVIVGGGSMPRSIVNKFMELAGGSNAKIVYLPTAVPPSESPETSAPAFFAGAAKVTVLNQHGPVEVNRDEFCEALNEATAVWFGGGRQWNFVDAYEDTQAIQLFHAVLERGGVIGGSSAGATIQGEFLVRGHPLGNTVMMAEGYERGFSFLPGSAIDQHFSQRNRFADLEVVVKKHQDLLGVGIDEGTALVVQPKLSEVIGNGSVFLMRSKQLTSNDAQGTSKSRFIEVPTGSKVDLISLEVSQ